MVYGEDDDRESETAPLSLFAGFSTCTVVSHYVTSSVHRNVNVQNVLLGRMHCASFALLDDGYLMVDTVEM